MYALALIAAVFLLAVVVVAVAGWSTRRTLRRVGFDPDFRPMPSDAPPPPPPRLPMTCPHCSGTDVEEISSGLWDGVDPSTGAAVGGTNEYGVCRRCQTRVARRNDGPCYTPSDAEWRDWAL